MTFSYNIDEEKLLYTFNHSRIEEGCMINTRKLFRKINTQIHVCRVCNKNFKIKRCFPKNDFQDILQINTLITCLCFQQPTNTRLYKQLIS